MTKIAYGSTYEEVITSHSEQLYTESQLCRFIFSNKEYFVIVRLMMDGGDGGGSGVGHGGGAVRVGGDVLVDDGGLDDLLDLVDLVGLGDGHGLGHLDGVGPVDVLGHDDLPLDGNGHLEGGVIGHLVHLELGHDLGLPWGDDGVGAHGGGDPGLGHGVGGSGTEVAGRGGDDGSHGGGVGEGGLGDGHGLLVGLGGLGDDGVGGGLVDGLASDVGVDSDLDGPAADLDGLVADDAVLDAGGGDGRAGVVGLGDVRDGRSLVHAGSDVGDRGAGGGDADTVSEMAGGCGGGAHRQHGNHDQTIHLEICVTVQ